MILKTAVVRKFPSIEDSGTVRFEPDRYRPARCRLAHQQRLLPAIGGEPPHRFARLFATLDEL